MTTLRHRKANALSWLDTFFETWLSVVGFEGLYEVSDLGRVRSTDCILQVTGQSPRRRRGRLLVLKPDIGGYLIAQLSKEGQTTQTRVHVAVLEAFRFDRPPGAFCRHMNGDKKDNRLHNLCWGTRAQNEADKIAHGTSNRGERHGMSKLTYEDVHQIRKSPKSDAALARSLGVSRPTITHVRNRSTWKHVD